jgi:hypothetical protein
MTSAGRPRNKNEKKQSRPGTRAPRRRPASPYAPLLAGAAAIGAEDSVLAAEVWAAGLLGVMWAAGWTAVEETPDDLLDGRFGELVDYLVGERSPAALSALRALALVGEQETRDRAAAGAEMLASSGVREPAWLDRTVPPELTEAFAMQDLFGDIEVVLLGFWRPEGHHGLLVFLDHASGAGVAKIAFGRHEAGELTALAESLRDGAACPEPVRLPAAEARARLEDALDLFLGRGPDPAGAPDAEGEDGDPNVGWALLRARLDTLPDDLIDDLVDDLIDGPETEFDQHERIVERFLGSEHAKDLPDQEVARAWATVAADSALDAGRAPDRYGPLSLSFLLSGEVTEHLDIDAADLELLPAAVTAWAHFTADACGLGEQAHRLWDEALPGLLGDFAEEYADAESVEHRATCPEVVAFRSYGVGTDPLGAIERLREQLPPGLRGHLDEAARALASRSLPAVGADAATAVHQLKIKLRRTSPPIWRRVEVASTMTLAELHDVIQASFGWDDDHLWEFNTAYGKHGPVPDLGHQDPDAVALAQIAPEGTTFSYVFDFGDYWDHQITVEKVVPAARTAHHPRCTGGRQPDPIQYAVDEDDHDLAVPFRRELVDMRLATLRLPP